MKPLGTGPSENTVWAARGLLPKILPDGGIHGSALARSLQHVVNTGEPNSRRGEMGRVERVPPLRPVQGRSGKRLGHRPHLILAHISWRICQPEILLRYEQ